MYVCVSVCSWRFFADGNRISKFYLHLTWYACKVPLEMYAFGKRFRWHTRTHITATVYKFKILVRLLLLLLFDGCRRACALYERVLEFIQPNAVCKGIINVNELISENGTNRWMLWVSMCVRACTIYTTDAMETDEWYAVMLLKYPKTFGSLIVFPRTDIGRYLSPAADAACVRRGRGAVAAENIHKLWVFIVFCLEIYYV